MDDYMVDYYNKENIDTEELKKDNAAILVEDDTIHSMNTIINQILEVGVELIYTSGKTNNASE
jgi:hypothetical protein